MTFPDSFADAGKNRYTSMQGGDSMHELHNQYGFTHTSAAKQARFATFNKRVQGNLALPGSVPERRYRKPPCPAAILRTYAV